jgi:glycine cleavage system aminomethyltransferase T
LTSDVKHLASDAAQHSAWCSAKGRMLASFLVFRIGSDYQLQLSADLLPRDPQAPADVRSTQQGDHQSTRPALAY